MIGRLVSTIVVVWGIGTLSEDAAGFVFNCAMGFIVYTAGVWCWRKLYEQE